ncbi:putative DNA mismatch repair protein MutS [Gregarina niphandrodes]|uniref:DNA mismatch repair protein MutS n=1 Tax=Gregarina niphandrodes TaxID=110365 RepID=A0A023B617_GRENI|nr:putative DNA mismatch repair protein MutS [Gregarina niphandrodes]EZG64346.1 putative DNA mismatch repair protein MutS [Gregarina niphandrodes]|eukprot:XP_011130635.1 putative DNA mismatch repair protein MutS [Gregarina niphandrodes]
MYVSAVTRDRTSVLDANLMALGVLNPRPPLPQFSLMKYFSKQVTPMGKRRFAHGYLRHPLRNPSLVRSYHRIIDALTSDRMLSALCSQKLSRLPDLDKITVRLCSARVVSQQRQMLSLIVAVYDALVELCELRALLKDIMPVLYDQVRVCQPLIKLIETVFDVTQVKLNAGNALDQGMIIKAEVKELAEVYKEMAEARKRADKEIDRINAKCDGKVKVIAVQPHGQVFRIPRTVEPPNGSILIRVNKAEKIFTTQRMQEFNSFSSAASEQVSHHEDALISRSLGVMATYVDSLNIIVDQIGLLDILIGIASMYSLLNSAATTATSEPWIFPTLVEDMPGCLRVGAGRHPLLTLRSELSASAEKKCVPNDFNSEAHYFVITGPNMGGKSTFSKQQALIALMAGYGLKVPCESCTLQLMDVFWARIGAHDNPCRNSSTFMVETQETATMLDALVNCESRKRSLTGLVILDELGRGTSVKDGLKFASAIIKYLTTLPGITSLCATHFHELSLIPNTMPLKLGSSRGNNKYLVEAGVEKDSDGIEAARFCGFPSEIIEEAKALLAQS